MRHLDLYMDGVLAGEIVQTDTGKTTFAYNPAYQASPGATPLSLSMPLERQQHSQRPVLPFLQGLLPDSEGKRGQIGRQYGVNPKNPVALLEHVGADVAGAVQILPHGQISADGASRRGDVSALTEQDFSDLISDLIKNRNTWGTGVQGGRWSLPGAQPKVALFKTKGGAWAVPKDSTPTTHILKPSVEPYSDHHLNEFMTMHAADTLGLNVAPADVIYTKAGDAVFVSRRYDRVYENGFWKRLHQEDVCQALSVDPVRKYQSDGGPGVREIAKLFQMFLPEDRGVAAQRFFEAQCFHVAMQGTDAHAKNYSIMLSGERMQLAPMYDLASHAPYPLPSGESLKLSMALDGEYRMNAVGLRHLHQTARTLRVDPSLADERAKEILRQTVDAYLDAGAVARDRFGDDPFISKLTDAIAAHSKRRGWR